MKKTIKLTDILDYYDGIEVFEARDAIGGHYIALIMDKVGSFNRYLVTGTVPERLQLFRSGVLDLRTLLLEAPGGEWHITVADGTIDDPLVLETQTGPLSESNEFLPETGFILDDFPEDGLALQYAQERSNTVFEFSVEPPEAKGHRIRATTLAGILTHLQTLVSHAYQSVTQEQTRLPLSLLSRGIPNGALMDVVVPAAVGSFRVVLEAANPTKSAAFPDLAVGLKRVDELFATADNPDESLVLLRPHRGYLAGSYINLVRFLAKNKTGLRYSWATPTSSNAQQGSVSEPVARKLTKVLADFSNQRDERVTLRGRLYRVNRDTGTWGLDTGEGKRLGKVADLGPSLAGLQVGAIYSFRCVAEEVVGKEKPVLYLEDIL